MRARDDLIAGAGVPFFEPNPFATRFVRPGALAYRFASQDREGATREDRPGEGSDAQRLASIADRLTTCRVGLIVGPHGTGKSTLLDSLDPHLRQRFVSIVRIALHSCQARGWIERSRHARARWSGLADQLASLEQGSLMVIDGAEQLSALRRKQIAWIARRRKAAILATAHSPLGRWQVLHQTTVSRELVQTLTRKLVGTASPAVVQRVEQVLSQCDWITLENVRDFWFELYETVAPLVDSSSIERSSAWICQRPDRPSS